MSRISWIFQPLLLVLFITVSMCVWLVIRAQSFKTFFLLYFADMVRKIDSVFERFLFATTE